MRFDALLVVSFGGPEGPDDVMPFLQNIVRGRRVPDERLSKVADQYQLFGGVSPINRENRRLITDLRAALTTRDIELPVYWGNRNWYPLLEEAIADMRDDGVQNAAGFVTSAYSSYSSCRQYLENLEAARSKVGAGAPDVVKLRPFFNHPGFVEPLADGLREALKHDPDSVVLMTAHSIPKSMADASDYEEQLREVARRVAELAAADPSRCELVFQSRSGPANQPWLEPDISQVIDALPADTETLLVVPIGFVSDHMEVVHDLDLVAAEQARARGIKLVRTPTPGGDRRFADMVIDLVLEADDALSGKPVTPKIVGSMSAAAFPCKQGCCPPSR